MPTFRSFDGTKLSYEVDGDRMPAVLLHGFASNAYINWVRPGLVDRLVDAGRRTVALDMRGHGASGKPHDPQCYADGAMARDVSALLDELAIDRCDVVGYSMGANVAMSMLADEPRFACAVLGGIGEHSLHPRDGTPVADAMRAADKTTITDPVARSFRDFADLTRADRDALAAIMSVERTPPSSIDRIAVPVLVVCAADDPLAGDPRPLAAAIPGATFEIVEGSHLNVVNHPAFGSAIVSFLTQR